VGRPGLRLALVWILLLGGLAFVLRSIPGVPWARTPAPSVPEGLAMPMKEVPEGSAEELYVLGLAAFQDGRPEEAMALLDQSMAMEPTFAPIYVQKALALSRLETVDLTEIKRLLEKAVSLGFTRNNSQHTDNIEHMKLAGLDAPNIIGSMLLDRAVLLAFCSPPDIPAARLALQQARDAGKPAPLWLTQALEPAQVLPSPVR